MSKNFCHASIPLNKSLAVAGYLKWEGVPSHERIYQCIYDDKKASGSLYKHLRCQKTYRKRDYANQDRRAQIAERPLVADNRERLGGFEGDTVTGKDHKGVCEAHWLTEQREKQK